MERALPDTRLRKQANLNEDKTMMQSRLSSGANDQSREERQVSAAETLLNMAIERKYLDDIRSALLIPKPDNRFHLSIETRFNGEGSYTWVNVYGDFEDLLGKLDLTVKTILESGNPVFPENLRTWQKHIKESYGTGQSLILKSSV